MMINHEDSYYYVYVLESKKDGRRYTGYTRDLSSRFEAHCQGKVRATRHRRPLRLIYFEGCLSQKDATRREKHLKTHYGHMYMGKRLKSYFTGRDYIEKRAPVAHEEE